MEKSISIDKEKIISCIETLTTVEDLINTKNLSESFNDIENLFKEINFIHANCLKYKEPLNLIYDNLEYIKNRINYLTESLRETVYVLNQSEELTSSNLMELSRVFKKTKASNSILNEARNRSYLMTQQIRTDFKSLSKEITKIPKEEPEQETSGINTVPIGIAIGATGVLGSLGAVAVNEIYGSESRKKENKIKIEQYTEEDKENYVKPNKIKASSL